MNYQVKQKSKGCLIFLLEGELSDKEQSILEQEIFKYFKHDMHIDIRMNQILERTGHKLKDFISEIS